MKKNLLWFFGLAIMAATSFTIVSCNPDPCKDVNCGDNGICNDGTCDCTLGYEGVNCETESRTKLTGKYSTTEQCSTDPAGVYYEITVNSGSGGVTELDLLNFYN